MFRKARHAAPEDHSNSLAPGKLGLRFLLIQTMNVHSKAKQLIGHRSGWLLAATGRGAGMRMFVHSITNRERAGSRSPTQQDHTVQDYTRNN